MDLKETVNNVVFCSYALFIQLYSMLILLNTLSARSGKVKALMKEMTQLASSLPVNAGASIFVRQVSIYLPACCFDASGK